MDFNQDYKEFVNHITDQNKCGLAGPVKISKEEDAFVRLFVAYLNCRYPQGASQSGVEADTGNRLNCAILDQTCEDCEDEFCADNPAQVNSTFDE